MGAVSDIPENYSNVKAIMDQLNMEAVEFIISMDNTMPKSQFVNYFLTKNLLGIFAMKT